jgi:hypothetical protein
MSDFGTFLGKVAGKVMNAANTDCKLKCKSCDAITEHISVSFLELLQASGNDSNIVLDTFLVTMEYNPAFPLILGNPYACVKCKRVRYEGGTFSNQWNKRKRLFL